jgi:predicted MPP superfamily phosphohydrolase
LAPAFDSYRIVQLSDLHLAEGKLLTPDRLEVIIQRVNRLRPDLILITGDFVSHVDATSRDGISRLRRLDAPDGVFAITGNHDYWSGVTAVVQAVEQAGIRVLCNEHVLIRRQGAALAIAGLDDIWEGQYDLDAALRGIPAGAPVILMAHEPNYAEFVAQDGRVALQLSGHSHGGQVRLPGIGPLALPDQAYRYPMGLYRIGDMLLYVNRGIGLAQIPFRFNCRPEITTFVLAPA